MRIRVIAATAVADDGRAAFSVVVTNLAAEPANDVPVFVWTGESIVAMPADVCAPALGNPAAAQCTVDLPAHGSRTLQFVALHQAGVNRYFQVGAQSGVAADFDLTFLGRTYRVTNAEDSGPGSLRQAIEDVNRECRTDSCVIAFELEGPVPAEGWFTIQLQSALPALTATFVAVDGGAQTRHTGDSNPFGPEIMLDGSALADGHGLAFTTGRGRAVDLAIGRFPGNGIESASGGYFRRNFLGVDPSGRTAAPNGLRGISVTGGSARVVDNVLSGNERAGGFFWTTSMLDVYGNFVGVGADGLTPLGNGASGLFFHQPAVSLWRADVHDNVIGYNAHAGIGLSLAAKGDFDRNEFRHNSGLPIDVGLDGETPQTKRGLPGQGGRVGAPTITAARWDGSATVIEGDFPPAASAVSASTRVTLHVAPTPEGPHEVLAFATRENGGFRNGRFLVRVPQDLRGKFVRASTFTIYIYNWDDPAAGTSELSAPRQVE